MKKLINQLLLCAIFVFTTIVFQGCIKDTVTEQYTFYRPVYATKTDVFANIKSSAPTAIQSVGKLFIKDGFVFVNDVNKGVHVIDYRNPTSPKKVSFIHVPGNVDMAVRDNILYVDCYTSLVAIDITNPLSVVNKKVINGVFPHRVYRDFFPDTSLIITNWVRVDTIISKDAIQSLKRENWGVFFASSASPLAASKSMNGIGGSMARFALLQDRMYTVSNSDIKVFNTTVAENPNYVKSVETGVFDVETIFPFGNHLFLGSNTGMHIFNVSNVDNPVKTGSFTHARVCDPVIADDKFAYVTLRSGNFCGGFTNQLDVVNIANLSNPTLIKSYSLTNPHGLSKDGNLLMICDGSAGLKVFDAANVQNIKLLTTVTGMNTFDVIAINGYAFVVAKEGLFCIDYSQPNSAKIISQLSLNVQ